MKEIVTRWIVVLGLCLAAYIQHTGCSIDGLPKAVQPPVRAAQAACARGIGFVGSSARSGAQAAQPHIKAAKAACARFFGTVGAKLALLQKKLNRGSTVAEAKAQGASHAEK